MGPTGPFTQDEINEMVLENYVLKTLIDVRLMAIETGLVKNGYITRENYYSMVKQAFTVGWEANPHSKSFSHVEEYVDNILPK